MYPQPLKSRHFALSWRIFFIGRKMYEAEKLHIFSLYHRSFSNGIKNYGKKKMMLKAVKILFQWKLVDSSPDGENRNFFYILFLVLFVGTRLFFFLYYCIFPKAFMATATEKKKKRFKQNRSEKQRIDNFSIVYF